MANRPEFVKCVNCRFWNEDDEDREHTRKALATRPYWQSDSVGPAAECRRYAPGQVTSNYPTGGWPSVRGGEWCGEWIHYNTGGTWWQGKTERSMSQQRLGRSDSPESEQQSPTSLTDDSSLNP